MVRLFVGGNPIGTLADAAKVFADVIEKKQSVEFRDESGTVVGAFIPAQAPTPPDPLVPWDPSITREELDRRAAEPGLSIEEMRERLGWA